MYMWLVLSTFLAVLAGYSLPVRSDLSEQKDLPVATAHVYRMVINHKTALEYVKSQKWPYYCGEISISDGIVLEECEDSDKIGYEAGIITKEMVEDFKAESFVFDEDNYVSQIFCLNADDTEVEDCLFQEGNEKKRFLVTYGDLHEKWISSGDLAGVEGSERVEVMPNDDILRGLSKSFPQDALVGYVREDTEGVHIINSWGTKVLTIWPAIWEGIFNSNMCNKRFNGSCMIQVNAI